MVTVKPTFLVDTGVWVLESTGWASVDPTDGGPPASMLSSPTPTPTPTPNPTPMLSTSGSSFGNNGDASYTIYAYVTFVIPYYRSRNISFATFSSSKSWYIIKGTSLLPRSSKENQSRYSPNLRYNPLYI